MGRGARRHDPPDLRSVSGILLCPHSPLLPNLKFPTPAPPGERCRKRALPGNAGARRGGRCLLDRVSFGRRLLAASAEGSSAAAAAPGASTYPSLTLAEICCRGVLPNRKRSSPSARGLRMPSGQRVGLGLLPLPDLCAAETCLSSGKCVDAGAQPIPAPRLLAPILARSFLLNAHSQVSVCLGPWAPSSRGGLGGADAQVPAEFSRHRDVPPEVCCFFSTLNPQQQEPLSNPGTPLPDLWAPCLCPLRYRI